MHSRKEIFKEKKLQLVNYQGLQGVEVLYWGPGENALGPNYITSFPVLGLYFCTTLRPFEAGIAGSRPLVSTHSTSGLCHQHRFCLVPEPVLTMLLCSDRTCGTMEHGHIRKQTQLQGEATKLSGYLQYMDLQGSDRTDQCLLSEGMKMDMWSNLRLNINSLVGPQSQISSPYIIKHVASWILQTWHKVANGLYKFY